jgi:hypothetical protein
MRLGLGIGFTEGDARGQGTVFRVTLEELISEDHFCRVIDASPLALLVRKKQEIKILSLDLWQ